MPLTSVLRLPAGQRQAGWVSRTLLVCLVFGEEAVCRDYMITWLCKQFVPSANSKNSLHKPENI